MNKKSLIPAVVGVGILAGIILFLRRGESGPGPGQLPVDELPGYVFPPGPDPGQVIGPGGDVVADHYSDHWGPGDVADIIETHSGITDPLIDSYNDVRQYDTNRIIAPDGSPADFQLGDRFLDISPYGWRVFGPSDAYANNYPGKLYNLYGQGGAFSGLTHEIGSWL